MILLVASGDAFRDGRCPVLTLGLASEVTMNPNDPEDVSVSTECRCFLSDCSGSSAHSTNFVRERTASRSGSL